jgi:prevent-host-death family protein
MRYEIEFAPQAVDDYRELGAHVRGGIREAVATHLRYEPTKASRSRIKRLRGLSRPQYRLRVGDVRVFYDVTEGKVEILAIVPKRRTQEWLEKVGPEGMRRVALSKAKDDLSRILREAEREEIVITRHGKPAGILIGFKSEDDWFEYRLLNDARFLSRVEAARRSLKARHGVPIEDLDK